MAGRPVLVSIGPLHTCALASAAAAAVFLAMTTFTEDVGIINLRVRNQSVVIYCFVGR